MPLNNFGFVCDYRGHVLYRSAQPDARALKDLYQMGVRAVVKLNGGDDDKGFQGITIACPLAGWSLNYDTNDILEIVGKIEEQLLKADVLIHCTHGRDRTGMVCAAFRLMSDGASRDAVEQDRADFGVTGVIKVFDAAEEKVLDAIVQSQARPRP